MGTIHKCTLKMWYSEEGNTIDVNEEFEGPEAFKYAYLYGQNLQRVHKYVSDICTHSENITRYDRFDILDIRDENI